MATRLSTLSCRLTNFAENVRPHLHSSHTGYRLDLTSPCRWHLPDGLPPIKGLHLDADPCCEAGRAILCNTLTQSGEGEHTRRSWGMMFHDLKVNWQPGSCQGIWSGVEMAAAINLAPPFRRPHFGATKII